MTDQERARAEASAWQAAQPELAGLEPHVVYHLGYWWASFRPPGADFPMLGGTSLLIDLSRGVVAAASSSRRPEDRVADYEASLRT